MSIPACPDCGSTLGKNAHKCRCGWQSAASSAPRVDCFFAPTCVHPALISTDRYQRKGQFQNLCVACDMRLHHEKAEKWCMEKGLVTTDQKIAFCREAAKKMFRGVRFDPMRKDRVPGEDDEVLAA